MNTEQLQALSDRLEGLSGADRDALAELLRKEITKTARGRYFPAPRSCRKWVDALLRALVAAKIQEVGNE